MQRKKLASSKSKSQSPGTVLRVDAMQPQIGATPITGSKPIASTPSVPQEPLSEPEPCPSTPDIYITRWGWGWAIVNGHIKTPIPNVTNADDPVMVAKYLASHARGAINVIWW